MTNPSDDAAMVEVVEVTQADIAAAIDLKYALDDAGSTSWSLRTALPEAHPVAKAFARHRLAALTPPARVEGQSNTVAFVQEWLMNADYDPTQFDKDFAAAIDARCKEGLPARVEGGGFAEGVFERAIDAVLAEKVDWEATQEEGDRIYNQAIDDAVAAIRALHPAALPPEQGEVERLREIVAGFVADLTDCGRNRGTCLSVNHDALNRRLNTARAALATQTGGGR